MNTGLTTFDGFPRSDIDVAQSRQGHHLWEETAYTADSSDNQSAHNTAEE